VKDYGVIRSLDNPYHKEGGIAILRGNLAPGGAVVKQSAVAPEMMVNEGKAIVFNSEEEAMKAILNGKVKAGHIIVVRYEGPKGGPGMRKCFLPLPRSSGWSRQGGCSHNGRAVQRRFPRSGDRPCLPRGG